MTLWYSPDVTNTRDERLPEVPEEEKHHWVVQFTRYGKIYTYMFRSTEFMEKVYASAYAKHGVYPFASWVIVDGEMQKVVIE